LSVGSRHVPVHAVMPAVFAISAIGDTSVLNDSVTYCLPQLSRGLTDLLQQSTFDWFGWVPASSSRWRMHLGHEFVNGALHVAKIVRRRHPQHALPEEVNGYFAEGSI